MRKLSEDSQKFTLLNECKCYSCGRTISEAALNLIWYYDSPSAIPISGGILKPLSSGETAVVQFPFCKSCAPPCRKCHLPRKTKAVLRADARVTRELGREVSGFPGCRHMHILGFVI
jgi:hypothetical protein